MNETSVETGLSTHVVIRGHVFTAAEKAPFAPSGLSLLGALEYDERSDQVKCHECGVWIRGLGQHIRKHGLKRADYNTRHGLRRSTGLSGVATRQARSEAATAKGRDMAAMRESGKPRGKGPKSVESQNESMRCKAQLLFRVQVLAAQQGHTPTAHDMRDAGFTPQVLINQFGTVAKAFALVGLQSNTGTVPSPLPKAFPTESEIQKRWNARMPWPGEYFDFEAIALARRQS